MHLQRGTAHDVERGAGQGIQSERRKHEPCGHCAVVVIARNTISVSGVLVFYKPPGPVLRVMGAASEHKQPRRQNVRLVACPVAHVRQNVAARLILEVCGSAWTVGGGTLDEARPAA